MNEDAEPALASDASLDVLRAKRARAEQSWIQARTWSGLGKIVTKHNQKFEDFEAGDMVLICRQVQSTDKSAASYGLGQNKEARIWLGPGKVVSKESNKANNKGGNPAVAHLIHVPTEASSGAALRNNYRGCTQRPRVPETSSRETLTHRSS